ncbi:hypothetical protein ACIP39_30135 [Streptomyces tibetensis]|uniref:hypothetical protein n=1 Tax=Streptomyces tibetensis TaxID=2382123 RepID=UPI0038097C8D
MRGAIGKIDFDRPAGSTNPFPGASGKRKRRNVVSISRKIVTGAVTLVSVAAISAAAAPVNAAPLVPSPEVAPLCSSSWKSAGSVPGRWTKVKDSTCSVIGRPGLKVGYQWAVQRGGSICVKVKGSDSRGQVKWYDAGCGKKGSVKVPWGNVADHKEMKVKGAALFKWR